MLAREGDMAFSILRRIIRRLPASIPVIAIFALITVVWSQNHTTVTRDGDFVVLSPADECERFPTRTRDDEEPKADEETRDDSSPISDSAKMGVQAGRAEVCDDASSRVPGFQSRAFGCPQFGNSRVL